MRAILLGGDVVLGGDAPVVVVVAGLLALVLTVLLHVSIPTARTCHQPALRIPLARREARCSSTDWRRSLTKWRA